MKAIFALAAGEEDADSDLSYGAGIVYAGIAQQMAVDEKKYNNRCESDRKSAAARWNEKKSAQEAAEAKTAAQDDAADQEPEREDYRRDGVGCAECTGSRKRMRKYSGRCK